MKSKMLIFAKRFPAIVLVIAIVASFGLTCFAGDETSACDSTDFPEVHIYYYHLESNITYVYDFDKAAESVCIDAPLEIIFGEDIVSVAPEAGIYLGRHITTEEEYEFDSDLSTIEFDAEAHTAYMTIKNYNNVQYAVKIPENTFFDAEGNGNAEMVLADKDVFVHNSKIIVHMPDVVSARGQMKYDNKQHFIAAGKNIEISCDGSFTFDVYSDGKEVCSNTSRCEFEAGSAGEHSVTIKSGRYSYYYTYESKKVSYAGCLSYTAGKGLGYFEAGLFDVLLALIPGIGILFGAESIIFVPGGIIELLGSPVTALVTYIKEISQIK